MFEWQYVLRYGGGNGKKPEKKYRKLLAVFLLFTLFSFINLDPVITFARYAVNLQKTLALNTANFHLTPALQSSNEVLFNNDEGFTDAIDVHVANYLGNSITTKDISYTLSIFEDRDQPLFNLFIDGEGPEGKVICPGNSINATLSGGTKKSNEHTIYLGFQDSSAPEESYDIIIKIVSSEPYVRSYNFPLTVKIESSLVLIEGTEDIYRPDVEIPEGEIMVFKDEEYLLLTPDDLINGPVVIDDVVTDNERPDLIGGSLYVPADVGEIAIGSNQTIDWDVYGHIVLEPDIAVNSGNTTINMLSHEGNIIMNEVEMTGGSSNPYFVEIEAEKGRIDANGVQIISKADGNGKISLIADGDVNINDAQIESKGNHGIYIESKNGDINAEGAQISSTNGASTAVVEMQAAGLINLDGATVSAKVEISIESGGDISARSANISNTQWGWNINITSTNGSIDLSPLTTGSKTKLTSNGSIYFTAEGDISIISAEITANEQKEISFESTGSGNTLYVQNAIVKAKTIRAKNLTLSGQLASGSGTITIVP